MLVGVSRHGTDALDQDDIGLADYATISPVYSPVSKPNDRRNTLGLEGLRDSVRRSYRPLVALGGIKPGRVSVAIAHGVKAVAVIGAVMAAENPASVVQRLLYEDAHRATKSRFRGLTVYRHSAGGVSTALNR